MNWEILGQVAFEAYEDALGSAGVCLWNDLGPQEKQAWINAARKAIAKFASYLIAEKSEILKDLTPVSPVKKVSSPWE